MPGEERKDIKLIQCFTFSKVAKTKTSFHSSQCILRHPWKKNTLWNKKVQEKENCGSGLKFAFL